MEDSPDTWGRDFYEEIGPQGGAERVKELIEEGWREPRHETQRVVLFF